MAGGTASKAAFPKMIGMGIVIDDVRTGFGVTARMAASRRRPSRPLPPLSITATASRRRQIRWRCALVCGVIRAMRRWA